ncbi:hypothetical protein J2Z19_001334 [Ensifer adhaerens]|uniref:Uncharacterized protein n=1 Tax=Ensifer adhaerens TaxID=106592 RepID=A0ACC5SRY2_ENSAD|nr:hypothetical protein [Ensifer adhaerens]MBP1871622.1 hypothetical protein [Ensifer adhaerens]
MTEAKASGSRIGEWFENRRTAKAICPAEGTIEPIGKSAGQNTTEPKESRQMEVFCPLSSFIGDEDEKHVGDP